MSPSKTAKRIRRLWTCFCIQICLFGYHHALGQSSHNGNHLLPNIMWPSRKHGDRKGKCFYPVVLYPSSIIFLAVSKREFLLFGQWNTFVMTEICSIKTSARMWNLPGPPSLSCLGKIWQVGWKTSMDWTRATGCYLDFGDWIIENCKWSEEYK